MTGTRTGSDNSCTGSGSGAVHRVAAVDVGTVSSRLFCAEVDAQQQVKVLLKHSEITDLGTGVDRRGALDGQAIQRTLVCVRSYVQMLAELDAKDGWDTQAISLTLTSAARDAANAHELLDGLRQMGLNPQIIPGQVEARLALLGVASAFEPGQCLLVADIGGGSTELARGCLSERGGSTAQGRHPVQELRLEVAQLESYDMGCRRLTERCFAGAAGRAATEQEISQAREEVRRALAPFFAAGTGVAAGETAATGGEAAATGGKVAAVSREATTASPAPETLCLVGGSATSMVSVHKQLEPYDPAQVHLATLTRAEVASLAQHLCSLTLAEKEQLPGLQPKRAAVIGAGALIVDVLMELAGASQATVSEADSLIGLAQCIAAHLEGRAEGPLGSIWNVEPAAFRDVQQRI